eukprot:589103-Rhodomonas_salina.1
MRSRTFATDDAALMAFNDDMTSSTLQLCSRGDYHVDWYNLRWIWLCLSTDRIVLIILSLLLVVAALILGYWSRIVGQDVHVTQVAYQGNIKIGVEQSQWGYEMDDYINDARLHGDLIWFDADVRGS